jgi:hypothetical protein
MKKSSSRIFGTDFEFTSAYPHGANILKKVIDGNRATNTRLLGQVARRYAAWRLAASVAPSSVEKSEGWRSFTDRQARLFGEYRNTLDTPEIDRAFDSRGALQPSALEEFCTYLFLPLVSSLGGAAELGKREVFHGLYFSAPDFRQFIDLPRPHYQAASVDFIISRKITSRFAAGARHQDDEIFVPAVAVECKTYLDRPRWFASEILAENLKRGFPYCRQFLLAEFLKLETGKVNIVGSRVDHVYVLRRSENIDRKARRAKNTSLPPIHSDTVFSFFTDVMAHLTTPWEPVKSWRETGVLK